MTAQGGGGRGRKGPPPTDPLQDHPVQDRPVAQDLGEDAVRSPLVTLVSPRQMPSPAWPGDEGPLSPAVPESVFEPLPSALVSGTAAGPTRKPDLIDRLWADRSIDVLHVDGPEAVTVERGGRIEPAGAGFADGAELAEAIARRLARPGAGVVEFELPDGSRGTAVFPPLAPNGPVLTLSRAAPGSATLEQLIARRLLDRRTADLLRLGARARADLLISGPSAADKTELLAALARDLGSLRIVTIARHRAFAWQQAAKIELVATVEPYAALLEAAERLRPHLLLVDSLRLEDMPALGQRLARGARGLAAAVDPSCLPAGLEAAVDLVVRLGEGLEQRARFAERVAEAGYGEALAAVLA